MKLRRAMQKRISSVAQFSPAPIARLVFLTCMAMCAWGQQPSLPAVNLGDTSFLDGIGNPGWLFEEIGQAVHDDKTLDQNGNSLPQNTDVNSGTSLTHLAWLSGRQIMGAWYGAEVLLPLAYVDTGGHGTGCCAGDLIVGPILQWPEKHLFGRPYYQRVVFDVYLPTGQYSRTSAVNIGTNAWAINPYYAFTMYPTKKLETSWRLHYLWNSVNSEPAISTADRSTQAGQAVHFNATLSYEVWKGIYIGANGYYLDQLTDAREDNQSIANSREQIGAIGPGMLVHRGKWFFYIDAYHEVGARDTTAGNKIVLRISKVS